MNLGFYLLIFQYTPMIGADTGWGKYEFFVFLATTLFINSLVQAFFMPNAEEFSELIRTGGLDFALLKPIDTQFLISLHKDRLVEPGELRVRDRALLGYSLAQLDYAARLRLQVVLYPVYVAVRRGDSLQPDDRAGGDEHLAGPESDALRLLVLHHELLALPDGDLSRAARATRCGGCSRSSFRCWSWSTCPARLMAKPLRTEQLVAGRCSRSLATAGSLVVLALAVQPRRWAATGARAADGRHFAVECAPIIVRCQIARVASDCRPATLNHMNRCRMKLAFSSNAYLHFSIEETIARIAGLGYTGIELLADVPHAWPAGLLPERKESIRRCARRARADDLQHQRVHDERRGRSAAAVLASRAGSIPIRTIGRSAASTPSGPCGWPRSSARRTSRPSRAARWRRSRPGTQAARHFLRRADAVRRGGREARACGC